MPPYYWYSKEMKNQRHVVLRFLIPRLLAFAYIASASWVPSYFQKQPKKSLCSISLWHHRHNDIFLPSTSCLAAALDAEGPSEPAFSQQTPHSGRHFLPSHPAYNTRKHAWRRLLRRRGRFMEGWYYRLTLDDGTSFAFIISIEDAGNTKSDLRLACIQIVGPNDTYLVQADKDDSKFFAMKHQQGLGCTFEFFEKHFNAEAQERTTFMSKDKWYENVKSGFQILPTQFVGKIHGHDGTMGGVLNGQGIPGCCEFDFDVKPICGWGDVNDTAQRSTGGWLASFAVFEPHWQVTMADGRASGRVTWKNNETYSFENAKFYAEKNWGAALPMKWYWTQCNSFDNGYDRLAVTAGGGIRKVPFGRKEALGMVGVHYNGRFYEAVPWTGAMEWKVSSWGSWELWGKSADIVDRPFEVNVTYTIDDPVAHPGMVFRAPTPDEGMVYFCRDTFEANCTLTLWEMEWDTATKSYIRKPGPPLIDRATSRSGGAEIGGGPWWDEWKASSRLTKTVRLLLRLPFKVHRLQQTIRRRLKPKNEI